MSIWKGIKEVRIRRQSRNEIILSDQVIKKSLKEDYRIFQNEIVKVLILY